MSRVINIANPGTRRSRLRRTIAEILRQMMLKRGLDAEAKDMVATVVLSLEGIAETIEESTSAWEKRNYFLKADRFRRQWEWVPLHAERLRRLVLEEAWDQLPRELALLAPYFKDVRVVKLTRESSAWEGNYRALLGDQD